MDQGSPGHKLEDNLLLRELHWDEADLDEELHKAGGGQQAHAFWDLIKVCTVQPSQPLNVAKLGELCEQTNTLLEHPTKQIQYHHQKVS